MIRQNNNKLYIKLRNKYPTFIFEDIDIQVIRGHIKITFQFNLDNKITFKPSVEFPERGFYDLGSVDQQVLKNMAFHIGMVELISYWKATCSPLIIVKPFHLTGEQISWWKKLFYSGLGEFFYMNGLALDEHDFVEFESGIPDLPVKAHLTSDESYIVPIGGGKDSVVTLELLKNTKIVPLILNPREASLGTAKKAGFTRDQIIEVRRKIDPNLLELNSKGFLNGHTPFSALVAFVSLIGAALCGSRNIALSNESSANEATIPGTDINHQYSKSIEFEEDFRGYVSKYITDDLNWFSLLRPLNELQIAQIFSKHPKYFNTFKSCNAGSKTDIWCQKCPKCLFTYIILSPFIDEETLRKIFGANLLDDQSLLEIFNQLTGISDIKPFECVGTVEEVNGALLNSIDHTTLPVLLESYRKHRKTEGSSNTLSGFLKSFNPKNNLTDREYKLLKLSLNG